VPETYGTFRVELNADLVTFGDNVLGILLVSSDNLRHEDIIIDEIKIKGMPKTH
tara:strand:+ start:691 stop:852 length:162 start_codon:yes stop_codon:yes gene_type:complete